jgi:hypothetical protein
VVHLSLSYDQGELVEFSFGSQVQNNKVVSEIFTNINLCGVVEHLVGNQRRVSSSHSFICGAVVSNLVHGYEAAYKCADPWYVQIPGGFFNFKIVNNYVM